MTNVSSTIDAALTMVMGDDMVKVRACADSIMEWILIEDGLPGRTVGWPLSWAPPADADRPFD